ncbi:cilia- and flagella-associated protein 263-like [Calliopsis andreniformis]|uniref:cilia- and flagella-associated protein 263-like n=1 Tax=Calliopsis andreniformis TaxID=337506 RepID=UPI003FCE05C1
MSTSELYQLQDELLQKIRMLSIENDIYERYLTRHDPHVLKSKQFPDCILLKHLYLKISIAYLLERAKLARRLTVHLMPKSSRMSFHESILSLRDGRPSIISTPSVMSIFSGSRIGTSSILTTKTIGETSKLANSFQFPSRFARPSPSSIFHAIRITMAHRMTMANKEVSEMKKKFEAFRESAKRKKANMRAEIEELEIRVSEVHEAREEFEEEIVIRGIDDITGKIPAEKIIRFIEEWLRSANMIIERLRLKSATIRMQIKKARQQLIQREELGETLHAVDFEQLNIQNKDYVKMIEEKNHYVHEMKRIAGHYHLKLTQHKQKLGDLMQRLNGVRKEIALKQQQIEQLETDRAEVSVYVMKKNKVLEELLNFMDNHTAPDVLDFVRLQIEVQELQRTYKQLSRRRDIQKIIFQSYKKQIQHKAEADDLKWEE